MNARMDTAAMPYSGKHGDEDWPTAEAQALIEPLAEQMVLGRLYNDGRAFSDLFSGIDSSDYLLQLQRALRELDGACKGSEISRTAVLTALSSIQRVFVDEAREVWLAEMSDEATARILEAAP